MSKHNTFDNLRIADFRILLSYLDNINKGKGGQGLIAEDIGCTQGTVSKTLSRISSLNGRQPLHSTVKGGKLELTPYGKEMLKFARKQLSNAERLLNTETKNKLGNKVPSGLPNGKKKLKFRIAVADYLDPMFLPELINAICKKEPLCHIETWSLSRGFDYHNALMGKNIDIVVGNWLLKQKRLTDGILRREIFTDKVAFLIHEDHASKASLWGVEEYLNAEHIAPAPWHPHTKGSIDDNLMERHKFKRNIIIHCAYFNALPHILIGAPTPRILTTGKRFCDRFIDIQKIKNKEDNTYRNPPLVCLPCPKYKGEELFSDMIYYYLVSHERRNDPLIRSLVEMVESVAASIDKNYQMLITRQSLFNPAK